MELFDRGARWFQRAAWPQDRRGWGTASGSFFRRLEVGRATFTTQQTVELSTAPGLFDSGINEVLLASEGPLELVSLQSVDVGEHDSGIRVFGRK